MAENIVPGISMKLHSCRLSWGLGRQPYGLWTVGRGVSARARPTQITAFLHVHQSRITIWYAHHSKEVLFTGHQRCYDIRGCIRTRAIGDQTPLLLRRQNLPGLGVFLYKLFSPHLTRGCTWLHEWECALSFIRPIKHCAGVSYSIGSLCPTWVVTQSERERPRHTRWRCPRLSSDVLPPDLPLLLDRHETSYNRSRGRCFSPLHI